MPVDHAWLRLQDVYRALRIPIADRDRESRLVRSGPLNALGSSGAASEFYLCPVLPQSRIRDDGNAVVTVATVLDESEIDGMTEVRSYLDAAVVYVDPSGSVRQVECESRGVLEARIFRALEQA